MIIPYFFDAIDISQSLAFVLAGVYLLGAGVRVSREIDTATLLEQAGRVLLCLATRVHLDARRQISSQFKRPGECQTAGFLRLLQLTSGYVP